MDERVHVRRVEVVLLVPRGRRQHDVRVHAGRRHPEVERDEEVELAFRRLVVPDDVLGLLPAEAAEILALHAVVGAEQVLEEVLVALAGAAEQVRAPDEQVAREVGGVVRIVAGHLQAAGLQHADRVVLRFGTRGRGVLHHLQRIRLQLRRARQPAHPLGADVEVDEAPRVFVRVGERRQDLLDLDLLVAPLVGVRVEERRRVHVPRRPVPVERERERGPARLRTQLFLADVMRPAAARLPDAAAHHQHVDDAAVVHVAVEPVVHRGADDHHRLAVRLVGVVGELAGDGDDLLGRHAGDLLLPCRRVGDVVVVATRRRCRRPGRGRCRNSRT